MPANDHRSKPPPPGPALVVFFAIGAFVEISPARETLGNTWLSLQQRGGRVLTLSGSAMSAMTLAWWVGVTGVLKFFWLRRRAARRARARRADHRSAMRQPSVRRRRGRRRSEGAAGSLRRRQPVVAER